MVDTSIISLQVLLCVLLTTAQDCSVSNDRLLFYTIKPDCSIRIATGSLPTAHFKPSTTIPCTDPSTLRHGTFNRDEKPGILIIFRNAAVDSRSADGALPYWVTHLVDVSASESSAFSMTIGDEDYFLFQKELWSFDACSLGLEGTLLCVGTPDRKSLRIDRYQSEGQNISLISSSSIPLNNGELAGRSKVIAVNQSNDGAITVMGWSDESRKIALITINADGTLQSVKKQLFSKEFGAVISISGDTVLTRSCDGDNCKTFMRSLEGKAFRCVHSGQEMLSTLGVISPPPLKLKRSSGRHKIVPRTADNTTEEPETPVVPAKELPHETTAELMSKETWRVYETMNDITQVENEPNSVIAVQTVFVFLYLLVFTVVMFIRTVEEDEMQFSFTTEDRAHMHDYLEGEKEGLVEHTPPRVDIPPPTKDNAEEDSKPDIVRESSAGNSEAGSLSGSQNAPDHTTVPAPSSKPTPTPSTTTVATITRQPSTVVLSSSAESISRQTQTEDHFLHEEDRKSIKMELSPKKTKEESSSEPIKEKTSPPKEKKKLMETETEGFSPNLTTASRLDSLPPLPLLSPPQKSPHKSVQKSAYDRPLRLPPTRRIPSEEALTMIAPSCAHHPTTNGFSTCTALCTRVTAFNRSYAMGLGRSGAPLFAESSDSGRGQKEKS